MAALELPCVVWVDLAPGTQYGPDPTFGILVDRRQRADQRGNLSWEGFVVMGSPGDDHRGASVRAEWVRFAYLTPLDVPRPPKRGTPDARP